MFCNNCGKENEQGTAFCTGCGAPLAENQQYAPAPQPPIQKPAAKKNVPALAMGVLSIVLAVALVLSLTGVLGGAVGASGVASKSFGTPEDAINYFVGCMKTGDFGGALAACGISETAQNFDYKAYVERIQAIIPMNMAFMPSEYKPYIEFNKARLTQQILMQMTGFTISLNLPEEYIGMINGETIPLTEGKLPEDLMAALDPAQIKDLVAVKIVKASMHDSDVNREHQKEMAKTYGADDLQFRTVLYELNGNYYVGGFTLVQYGGSWFINSMVDPLAGIPYLGTPMRISSEDEFNNMLG